MKIFNKIKYFLSHPIVRYYFSHPVVYLQNRLLDYGLWLKKPFGSDPNFNPDIKSDLPIDVVIVAIDKDYDVLTHVIDSVRENLKHPIGDIIIISPKSELIQGLCKKKKCVFVDENTVLPITKKDIYYKDKGQDRSGWLFQQLLKWSGNQYGKNEYFLIADADTVFCRPQVFIYKGKVIVSNCHQLGHIPYYEVYPKLTGEKANPVYNFTSHHSLFEKKKLAEVKRKIEKHCGKSWYQAIIDHIDPNEGSYVSDYETYAQFVFSHYPNYYLIEHWFNLSLNRPKLKDIKKIVKRNSAKHKTISFHSYNDK